jgi:uncharacterized membrane protein (DUF2068 family)
MVSRSPGAALRTVALFEGAKGALVLVVGVGLLSLVHRDLQRLAGDLVRHYHLNPAHHYPQIFIHAAAHLTNTRIQMLAAAALLYALVRLVEAYGLWRGRPWAEWFAVLSGGIYIPLEIDHLFHHASWANLLLLTGNALIVGYLAFNLTSQRRREH